MLEDVEEMLESLKGGFASLESPLADVASKFSALRQNVNAWAVAGKQGRDELGHFTTASKGLSLDAQGAAGAIKELGSTATSLAFGAIPAATQAFGDLGRELGSGIATATATAAAGLAKLGPEGAAAGAALEAVGVVAGATVGTLMTLAGIAVEASEKLELLSARMEALAGSERAGAAVEHLVERLSDRLPFATAQIAEWSSGLIRAGVAGKNLEAATRAVAASEALGAGGGRAMENLIGKLSRGGKETDQFVKTLHEGGTRANKLLEATGLKIADIGTKSTVAKMGAGQLQAALEEAMILKGAGPLDVMAKSFPNIIAKAQEGFRSLFTGVDLGPFMTELQSLFGEFNKGGNATKGLRPIVTDVLGGIFSFGTKALHVVHDLVLAFEGKGKPGALTSIVEGIKAIASNEELLNGIKVVFVAIGAAVVLATVPIVAMVAATVAVAAGVTAAVGWIAEQFALLPGVIDDVVIKPLLDMGSGALTAAQNFIDGLVQGIESGVDAVTGAVSNLAKRAEGAFTSFFGIHSPSTRMRKHGDEGLDEGVAVGVDAGAPRVERAMTRMSARAMPGKRQGTAGGQGGSGKSYSLTLNNCTFGGDTTLEKVRSWWRIILEEMSAEAGAQPETS